jgi:hypothetical protein
MTAPRRTRFRRRGTVRGGGGGGGGRGGWGGGGGGTFKRSPMVEEAGGDESSARSARSGFGASRSGTCSAQDTESRRPTRRRKRGRRSRRRSKAEIRVRRGAPNVPEAAKPRYREGRARDPGPIAGGVVNEPGLTTPAGAARRARLRKAEADQSGAQASIAAASSHTASEAGRPPSTSSPKQWTERQPAPEAEWLKTLSRLAAPMSRAPRVGDDRTQRRPAARAPLAPAP